MHKSKLILALVLGLAVSLSGIYGCAGKKKPPEEQEKAIQAPEKKPAPPAPRVERQRRRTVEEKPAPTEIKFQTIYFDFDKSDIKPDQRSSLSRNADLMMKNNSLRILIGGHCDERGTNEYNLALGQRRADSVQRFLVDYGISSSRIQTISYGEERPVDSGHNESAWSKNRRCELTTIQR